MNTQEEFARENLSTILARYKFELDITTDEALAHSLGVSKTAMSNYRNGTRRLPDAAIVKLADVTGIDAREILTAMNLNLKDHKESDLSFWLKKATAFTVVMTAIASSVTPQNANASPSQVNAGRTTLCIMSTRRKLSDWLKSSLLRFVPMQSTC